MVLVTLLHSHHKRSTSVTGMIIHFLRIKVSPKDRINAIRTIHSAIGPTKAKKECLTCSIYSDIDNDDELLLIQKWTAHKALENYIASPTYNLLLEGIELAIEKPVIEFHTVADTRGFEYVENIRQTMSDDVKRKGDDVAEIRG